MPKNIEMSGAMLYGEKKFINLVVLFIFCFLSIIGDTKANLCNNEIDPLGARLEISVFRFAGSLDGDGRNQFSRFKRLISDIVRQIPERIALNNLLIQREIIYMHDLKIMPPGEKSYEDKLSTEDDAMSFWNASHSLMLMRGEIERTDNVYFANSRLFIGENRGLYPEKYINFRSPLDIESVPLATIWHSLVTYYALAMDAQRLGCQPQLVNAILSRALDRLNDLKVKIGDTPNLSTLELAIAQFIEGKVGNSGSSQ
jgi:hypothetical protein